MTVNDDQCIDEPDMSSSDPIDKMKLCDLRQYAKRLRDESAESSEWLAAYRDTVRDMAGEFMVTQAELRVAYKLTDRIRAINRETREDVIILAAEIAKLKEHLRNGTTPAGGIH